RTTGLLRLGVSTDAARAKKHRAGRQLSAAIHGAFAIDGLLYASRLTSAECVAVYDRAIEGKLDATPAINLVQHPDLIGALQSIGVSLRGGA
ncbi:MAG: RES domain-containing protein, partial [Mesorhizobium sp.]